MMLVQDLLSRTAAARPGHTAIIAGRRQATFGEVAAAARGFAAALQAAGLRRGERVILFLDSSVDMVAAMFGTAAAGGVFVPVYPGTRRGRLAYLLRDSGAAVLVAAAGLRGAALGALAETPQVRAVFWSGEPPPGAAGDGRHHRRLAEAFASRDRPGDPGLIDQDLATIIYTSGSTGEPKGVMLTHHNVCNTAWAISTYLGNRPDDVVICVLPLSFDYGLYQVLTGARVGFTVVLERSFAFPRRILERMAAHRVTGLPGVPTVFATLLQHAPFAGLDLSALRYLTNTAAALPPAHIHALRRAFPGAKLFSMYGLTECTRVSWLDPERLDDKIASVGKAMPNSEAYVVDEQGRRLPPGVVGELVVRGANVMRGYWRKPEATARRLRDGEIAGEKVLHTGDLFRIDDEGFLYFVGRRDDVFKCRGEKVAPKEVELVLCEMDEIAEAAVLGVPDRIDGTAVKAVVVPRPGVELSESAVRRHCRARLESHLVPRIIEIRAALPRSDNGKVRKALLAAADSPRNPADA